MCDRRFQLPDLFNIRTHALMPVIGIGITEMVADYRSDLAKQDHCPRQLVCPATPRYGLTTVIPNDPKK
jgi:hypothetical protein